MTSSSEHEHAEPLRCGELYCAHHREAPPATESSGDGFVLYDCEQCDYLCAVRVSEGPGEPHVCGVAASGDSDSTASTSASESESDSEHPMLGPGQFLDEEGHVRDPWD